MTYNSLDTIPYKLFLKIAESGNLNLLSDSITDAESLQEIWMELYDEHLNQESNAEGKRVFRISKEVESLEIQLKIVLMSCDALKFEVNDDLIALLKKYGYKLRIDSTENYYSDIDQVERESNALKIKIKTLKKLLPNTESDNNSKYNIDDVMAGFCSILGFNIGDFNTVTYTAFFGYEKQVNAKIKAIKDQQNTRKNAK